MSPAFEIFQRNKAISEASNIIRYRSATRFIITANQPTFSILPTRHEAWRFPDNRRINPPTISRHQPTRCCWTPIFAREIHKYDLPVELPIAAENAVNLNGRFLSIDCYDGSW